MLRSCNPSLLGHASNMTNKLHLLRVALSLKEMEDELNIWHTERGRAGARGDIASRQAEECVEKKACDKLREL